MGVTANTLGVRVPPDAHPDLPVNSDGTVTPRTGGMSVAPSWRLLPPWRIPRRLGTKSLGAKGVQGARGSDALICWRMGVGSFAEGMINDLLLFRPDPADSTIHGVVEPAVAMPQADYQTALAATRDEWQKDET